MKTAILSFGVCLMAAPLVAGEVKVEKTHICCPACVKAIEGTLEKVEGVSDVSVDKDAGSVSFSTTDNKVARKAVVALGRAGFGGAATHDGKAMKLPAPNVEEGTKADEVKLTRIHLCCGKCVTAVEGAVSKVDGVESVTCDKDKGTCMATGKDVDVLAVIQALRDAGFNGTVPGPKGAKGKGKKKQNADN